MLAIAMVGGGRRGRGVFWLVKWHLLGRLEMAGAATNERKHVPTADDRYLR